MFINKNIEISLSITFGAKANLNVAKTVGHAGWVPHGNLSPEQVLWAIQGGDGSEPNSVGEVREILQLWQLWKCNVVVCCLLFQTSPEKIGFELTVAEMFGNLSACRDWLTQNRSASSASLGCSSALENLLTAVITLQAV